MSRAAAGALPGWQSVWQGFLGSPLYKLTLLGETPSQFRHAVRDPWPGLSRDGEELVRTGGAVAAALRRHAARDASPALARLHGFEWLRDLRALGGDEARRQARELVGYWITENDRWSEPAWRPDVTGTRLVAWLGNHDFFAASADDDFRRRVLASLCRQARHLARTIRQSPPGSPTLAAAHGLVVAGLALTDGDKTAGLGLQVLTEALEEQLLDDGGHCERSPAVQLTVLRRLIEVRAALRAASRPTPQAIQDVIARMAAMLRLLRHGDGGLAIFNDSQSEEGWAVDLALTHAETKTRPPIRTGSSGFERLAAGRTLVIADVGAPPPAGFDRHAHAGTLSFEMSVGKERLIVNCGAPGQSEAWRGMQRATAAHSTLCVEDTHSSEILPDGSLGHRPSEVRAKRREVDGAFWLEASHDGYRDMFGLVHHRELWLNADGTDLRGCDRLEGSGSGRPFAIRFHLHPKVKANPVQDGSGLLLRLPGGGGWRFRASASHLSLTESIYLGDRGAQKRTRQIVLEGVTGAEGALLKWAFQAVPRR